MARNFSLKKKQNNVRFANPCWFHTGKKRRQSNKNEYSRNGHCNRMNILTIGQLRRYFLLCIYPMLMYTISSLASQSSEKATSICQLCLEIWPFKYFHHRTRHFKISILCIMTLRSSYSFFFILRVCVPP